MAAWDEKCKPYFKANDCIAGVESWVELVSFLFVGASLFKLASLIAWALPSWWLLAGSAVAIYLPFWVVKKIVCRYLFRKIKQEINKTLPEDEWLK